MMTNKAKTLALLTDVENDKKIGKIFSRISNFLSKLLSVSDIFNSIACFSQVKDDNKLGYIFRSLNNIENVNIIPRGSREQPEKVFTITIENSTDSPNPNPAIITSLQVSLRLNGKNLSSNSRKILMNGDRIATLGKEFVFIDKRVASHQAEYCEEVKSRYFIGGKLGSGCNGTVRIAYNLKTLQKSAIKKMSEDCTLQTANELRVLTTLHHPHLVSLVDKVVSPENTFLFIEYMDRGDLSGLLKRQPRKQFSESTTKFAIHQVCEGLDFLHRNNFAHLDVKLCNILINNQRGVLVFKLADFGLSAVDENLTSRAGTRLFCPPEIMCFPNGGYLGKRCDMWSLGVVIFVCLSGTYPFNPNSKSFHSNIEQAKLFFDVTQWRSVSSEAKKLIRRLIVVDPAKRLSAKEVQEHSWLSGDSSVNKMLVKLNSVLQKDSERNEYNPSSKRICVRC